MHHLSAACYNHSVEKPLKAAAHEGLTARLHLKRRQDQDNLYSIGLAADVQSFNHGQRDPKPRSVRLSLFPKQYLNK